MWTTGARFAGFIKRNTILYCYKQNMKALGLVVSEKKMVLCLPMNPPPRGGARMDPRGTVGRIHRDHLTSIAAHPAFRYTCYTLLTLRSVIHVIRWYLYFMSLNMISLLLVYICLYKTATAEAEGEVMAMQNRFKPASNFVLLIVPSRYFCGGSFCFMSWCLKFLCVVGALCMFSYF